MPINVIGTAGLDISAQGTGAVAFPIGTTAQRPTGVTSGAVRYNTTLGLIEVFDGTNWIAPDSGRLLSIQTFTNDPGTDTASFSQMTDGGSFTWTKPTGCRRVLVYCTGGGAGSTSNDSAYRGWPGGAGATAIGLYDVSAVATVGVTVGSGSLGTRGVGNRPATAGTSSFGSFCSATGGRGGGEAPFGGGRGGFATGGNVLNIPGGSGDGNHSSDTELGGGASFWHKTGAAHNNGTGQGDTDLDRMRLKGRYGSGGGYCYGSETANENWRAGGAGLVMVFSYT